MVNWLKDCKVKTIIMESTGVYWIPAFELLESSGFEVKLVNARHVKNVSAHKTDVLSHPSNILFMVAAASPHSPFHFKKGGVKLVIPKHLQRLISCCDPIILVL